MIGQTSPRQYAVPGPANAALVLMHAGLFVAFAWAAAYLRTWWHVLLLAGGFGVYMNAVYAVIHEAEHGILFRRRAVNDGVGVAMALLFPAPFHLIRQGHIGHHLRNRSDDEAFDLYFDGEHPVWKFLQLYGILTGLYYLVVALSNVVVLVFPYVMKPEHFKFDRPSAAFMASLNPGRTRLIQAEGLAAIVLHTAVVMGFGIPLWHYLAMYAAFGFMWSAMQYVHHYGTERHVTRGARNLWIFAPLDRFWLNHNWHQTHHEHPTVPWVHLPAIGRQENPRRGFLIWAYLRMWRGPRRTQEHVENKYAGRIVD
jgi:fatty acid desaturase